MQTVEHSTLTYNDLHYAVRESMMYGHVDVDEEDIKCILDWYVASLTDYVHNEVYGKMSGYEIGEFALEHGICHFLRHRPGRPKGFWPHYFWDFVTPHCLPKVSDWNFCFEESGRTPRRLEMASTLLAEIRKAIGDRDANR